MIRVLLADDHAILRAGIRQLLAETKDVAVVGEAADGHGLLKELERSGADVVVMDITMPGPPAIDLVKRIGAKAAETKRPIPVLVLSMHPEEPYAARFLRSGARGYLSKERAAEELVKAIRKVHAGGLYVADAVREAVMEELARGVTQSHAALSDREFQVLMRLARGCSVTEIAAEFVLSVKTISTYRTRIFEKMGFSSNAELTQYAIVNKLLNS